MRDVTNGRTDFKRVLSLPRKTKMNLKMSLLQI